MLSKVYVETSSIACVVEHECLNPYLVSVIIECLFKKERVLLQSIFQEFYKKLSKSLRCCKKHFVVVKILRRDMKVKP